MPSASEGHERDPAHDAAQAPPDTLAGPSAVGQHHPGAIPFPMAGDPGERTRVRVSTPDGAAELSIVDRTYALVASGVGWLDVMLPTGDYLVRQQVGDEENIRPFAVTPGGGNQAVELPVLRFPSPIPLPGTAYGDPVGSDLQQLSSMQGNFRLLLWAPTDGVPDNGSAATRDQIAMEFGRLRLEVFRAEGPSARKSVPLPDITWTGCGNALVAAELPPGSYVLVQRDDSGRQRCLPIWLRPGWVTSVFLLSLQMDGSRVPVRLDHAGIAFLRPEDFQRACETSLYRLEAARKAMTQGRQAHGWVWRSQEGPGPETIENPLLHLMDAMLFLSAPTAEGKEAALACGREASESFGEEFPDSMALRLLMKRLGNAKAAHVWKTIEIAGPPLLRRSWDILLRTPNGNSALSRTMNFPYAVDGTGTWFLWSEDPGSFAVAASVDTSTERPSLLRRSAPRPASVLGTLLATGATLLRNLVPREARPEALPGPEPAPLSFDNVVDLLVMLANSGILETSLEKGRKFAASKGVRVDDEVLQRLIQSLDVLSDKTLVKALTAEVLVREALVGLGLPKEKVILLVRSAFADLFAKVVRLDDNTLALKAKTRIPDKAD
jgi:hypothetical protein